MRRSDCNHQTLAHAEAKCVETMTRVNGIAHRTPPKAEQCGLCPHPALDHQEVQWFDGQRRVSERPECKECAAAPERAVRDFGRLPRMQSGGPSAQNDAYLRSPFPACIGCSDAARAAAEEKAWTALAYSG